MVIRKKLLYSIKNILEEMPVCALVGPRQAGKTTLAEQFIQQLVKGRVHKFDLENPLDLARLDHPMTALANLDGLVVIDEIQRRPELFPTLRVLADQKRHRFIILGSASPALLQQSSESLAGRIEYLEVSPFSLQEVQDVDRLWVRGGFPRSYLGKTDEGSFRWRKAYIRTFLERDIPLLGVKVPPRDIYRFWMMLAHYHGQICNASEIGRSLSISHHTVKKYLSILEGTFMIRVLQPWFENVKKRQIKAPKIYFRDNGILHSLLGLKSKEEVSRHPRLGASWEGFALEEVLRYHAVPLEEAFYWRTHGGAELDLLFLHNGRRIGFEFKYSDTPTITPSAKIALEDLQLSHLYVVYPGRHSFSISARVSALSLNDLVPAVPFDTRVLKRPITKGHPSDSM